MRYSWSFQQCDIVTSRSGNKQQVHRKRIMSVLGSRLCCTGTGKCFRKSEVADLLTGLLCWSLGTATRSFRTFPIALGAIQALHALISFRNSTCRTNEVVVSRHTSIEHRDLFTYSILTPYAYEVFLTKIFQSSIGHTLGGQNLGSSKSVASHRLIS